MKMKKIIYSIALLLLYLPVSSQSLDSLQASVKRNNHQLNAMEKWLEGEQARSRTGVYPDNPEVSYIYLWGNSQNFGNQQEFEVLQSFKFPGFYSSKADVQQQEFVKKQFLVQKSGYEIMHKVRVTFFKVVWLQKKVELLQARKQESEKLVNIMKNGFSSGEVSKPAYDKARILDIGFRNELQQTTTDIGVYKDLLQQMNGDKPIGETYFNYPMNWNLPGLDSLLNELPNKNLEIQIARSFAEENELNVKMEKMNSLPEIQAGYKSESFLNQKLNGVHAGVTIPLWQNKNRIKQAKLETAWSQASVQHVESTIKAEIVAQYNSVKTALDSYLGLKDILGEEQVSENSLDLLQASQISFPEYLMEMQFIFESQNKYLEIEKDYFERMSELMLKSSI